MPLTPEEQIELQQLEQLEAEESKKSEKMFLSDDPELQALYQAEWESQNNNPMAKWLKFLGGSASTGAGAAKIAGTMRSGAKAAGEKLLPVLKSRRGLVDQGRQALGGYLEKLLKR